MGGNNGIMIDMAFAVFGMGLWVVSDGILSWTLYLNAPSYDGTPKQSFKKDHWVRLTRIIIGTGLMICGRLLV